MKITKYVHSCLLIETPERLTIIDPGQFSFDSGLFDMAKLSRLDDIVITHEHSDHFHMPFVQNLIQAFPDVNVTSTDSVISLLKQHGIQPNLGQSSVIQAFTAAHESLDPLGQAPDNIGVHYLDELTHPGDCHHFSESKRILALPMTAPWGTVMRAAELGLELKPQFIIPIHDWHWNNEARKSFYTTFEAFFKQHGITFIKLEDGVAIEL